MKISIAETYARALLEFEKGGFSNDATARFVDVIKRRGHGRLLPQIALKSEQLKKIDAQKNDISVRIASEGARAEAEKELNPLLAKERVGERYIEFKFEVDPTLVSGFLIKGNDFRIDHSGRRALLGLFNKMTA